MKTIFKITIILVLLSGFVSCSKDDGPETKADTNSVPEIENQTFAVPENITTATIIGTIVATDADAEDTLSFSITTSTNTLFEITETGAISLRENQSLDFETAVTHSITVRVSDGISASSAAITINVTDIDENSAPSIADQSFTVAEDLADTTTIGTIVATDPDSDTLAFSITANDNDLFELTEAGALSLATGKTLDFETAQTHSITVQVTDGTADASAVISITVTDVAENTAPEINNQSFKVSEVIVDTQIIGIITATDLEEDTLTYSITTNSNPLFEIDAAGAVSLAANQNLDFETATSHTIIVSVNDGSVSSDATITINVTNIPDLAFVTTWETTSSTEIVTIPTRAAELFYSYTIDCGDGNVETGVSGDSAHVYQTTGIHTISIHGFAFPAIALGLNENSQTQFRSVESWGGIVWRSMERAFQGTDFTINTTETPNLTRVTNMASMFRFSKFNQDISAWDVSRVTDMGGMFSFSEFNQDISSWDVSRVTNMRAMFDNSEFNQNISTWNVSNVTNMGFMFNTSKFNQDISTWNVSNVTTMRAMFQLSEFNQNIGNWDVSNVTNMGFMFSQSKFNKNIGNWDVSRVTDMEVMFASTEFNGDISTWDVGSVTTMERMFRNSEFNNPIDKWDVNQVTTMSNMFEGSLFSQDITAWNVENVTNMEAMFKASKFSDIDISNWKVANVTNCSEFAIDSGLQTKFWPDFSNCSP